MRTRSGRIVQTFTTSRYAHVKTPVLDQLVLDITRYYPFATPFPRIMHHSPESTLGYGIFA
jgi:hypothetical protein